MNVELPDLAPLWPALVAAIPTVLVVIAAAILLNVVLGRGLRLLAHRTRVTEQELIPIRRVLKWLIMIAAAVLILGAFGMNLGGFWGVLSTVLAMVAIGFVAVWSVLSNTLCTLFIVLFRPFSVGDEVELMGDPVKGRVVDLNFLYTTLDAGDGTVLQIPNNLFFQKVTRRRHAAAPVAPEDHLRARANEPTETPELAGAAVAARQSAVGSENQRDAGGGGRSVPVAS